MKRIFAAIGLLIILSAFIGCSVNHDMQNPKSTDGETATINFLNWTISEEISAQSLLNIEKEYKLKNNVEIKNLPTTWQDMKYSIYTSLISRNPPDVIHIASPWFGQVYATNELEPLDDYIDPSVLQYFSKNMLEHYTVNGKLYALPWIEISGLIFWNKSVLQSAGVDTAHLPRTMDEFKKLVFDIGTMPIKGDKVYGFGILTGKDEITVNFFNVFLKLSGTDFLDENNHVAVDQEKLTALLQWYREIGLKNIIPKNMSIKDQYGLFVKDRIAGFTDGLYARNYLRLTSGKGEAYDDNIIVTAMPEIGGKSVSYTHDQLLVLTRSSKHKELAVDFMEYLCTNQNATSEYYRASGFAPASPKLLSGDLYIKDKIALKYVENLPNKFNYSIARTDSYYNAIEEIGTAINLVANGKMTAKEGNDYIVAQLKLLYD